MKVKVFLLLTATLFVACKKDDVGTMKYKNKYTTSTIGFRSASTIPDSIYSGYGDYITSITPYHFSAKIAMLMYQDVWSQQDKKCHMISYVDGHDNKPGYEIATYADFSGNQEVSIDPILYSTDIRDGIFEQKSVTFNFFTFNPSYFYQEFEIPIEFKNIYLANGNQLGGLNGNAISYDPINEKMIVKIQSGYLISDIFYKKTGNYNSPIFVFGKTSSTYIYQNTGQYIPEDQKFPFCDGNGSVLRCHKYSALTVNMPEEDETFTMYSTVCFDTNNLIQVYAGGDNIPYTNDDVFIYAPEYWERLAVKLEVK